MRINYPTGMWSERDGSKLTWGKGDITMSLRLQAKDEIKDITKFEADAIRRAKQDPRLFASVQSTILARSLIPEVEAGIAAARAAEAAKAEQEAAELQAAIASGEAFRAAEVTGQFGSHLLWARRFNETERPRYADWFQGLGMVGYGHGLEVEREAIRKVIGDRRSDGQFRGTTNDAWTISEEEWNAIVSLTAEIRSAKADRKAAFAAEEAADLQQKIATGYCFSCESWCHGDCGDYSPDPLRRTLREVTEAARAERFSHRGEG